MRLLDSTPLIIRSIFYGAIGLALAACTWNIPKPNINTIATTVPTSPTKEATVGPSEVFMSFCSDGRYVITDSNGRVIAIMPDITCLDPSKLSNSGGILTVSPDGCSPFLVGEKKDVPTECDPTNLDANSGS